MITLRDGYWVFEPAECAPGDMLSLEVVQTTLRGYVNGVLVEEREMTPEEYEKGRK